MRLDRRHLEKIGNQYRVIVKVTAKARPVLGKAHLKRPLHTDSLAKANLLKWPIVAEFKRQIAEAERSAPRVAGGLDSLTEEALEWRTEFDRKDVEDDYPETLQYALEVRAEAVAEVEGPARGGAFYRVAMGREIPLSVSLETWLAEQSYDYKTAYLARRALTVLTEWLEGEGHPTTVEAVTRKIAGQFISEGLIRDRALSLSTLRNYRFALGHYWAWMDDRGIATGNPWERQPLPRRASGARAAAEEKERPFTDDEVRKLLAGNPGPLVADLMRVGALTGARIEALCLLRVRDVREDGCFIVPPLKREPTARIVPIHSTLADVVTRRVAGKAADAYLFHEIPEAPVGSQRERSQPPGKRFGRYLRDVGVAVIVPGKRRSLVNFHSFRRWFMTKAEQAGQPESTIQAVVGQKRTSVAFGTYSGGPSLEQLRACVEAVTLPDVGGSA